MAAGPGPPEPRGRLRSSGSPGSLDGGFSIKDNFLELPPHLTFLTEDFQAVVSTSTNLCHLYSGHLWHPRAEAVIAHTHHLPFPSLSRNSHSLSQFPKLNKQTKLSRELEKKKKCSVLESSRAVGCLTPRPRARLLVSGGRGTQGPFGSCADSRVNTGRALHTVPGHSKPVPLFVACASYIFGG